jgi:hypothetical protein
VLALAYVILINEQKENCSALVTSCTPVDMSYIITINTLTAWPTAFSEKLIFVYVIIFPEPQVCHVHKNPYNILFNNTSLFIMLGVPSTYLSCTLYVLCCGAVIGKHHVSFIRHTSFCMFLIHKMHWLYSRVLYYDTLERA